MSKAGTEKRKSFGLKALRHRMFGNKARKHEEKPDVLSDDEANPRSNSDDLSAVLSPANRSQSHELLAGDDDNNQHSRDRDDNRENETGERKTSPVQSRIERLKNELSKQQQQRPITSHHSPPGGRNSPKIKRLSHLPPAGLDQMLMKKGPPSVMAKKSATTSTKPVCEEVKHVEENKTEEPTNAPQKDEVEQDECKPAQTNAAADHDVTSTTTTTTVKTNPHNAAISRIAVRPKNRRAATRIGAKRQKIVTKDEDVDDFFAISSDVKAVTVPLDPALISESLDEQPSTDEDLLTTIEEDQISEVKCEETNNHEEEKPEEPVAAEAETEKVDEIQKPSPISRSSSKNSETELTSMNELPSKDYQVSTEPQSNSIVEDTKEEIPNPVEKSQDDADTQPPPVNMEEYKLKRDLSKIFEMTWNENKEESPIKSQSGSKSSLSDLSENNSPVKAPPTPIIKTVHVEETIEEETKDELMPPEQKVKQEESKSPKITETSTDAEPAHKKNSLKLRMKKITDPDRRKSSGSRLTPDAKDDSAPRFSLSIDNLKSLQTPSSPTSLFPIRLKKTGGRNLSDSGVTHEVSTRSSSKNSLEATPEPLSKSSIFRSPKKLFSHNKKRSTGDENTNNNNISWRTDDQQNSQEQQQVVSSPAASHNNSADDVFVNNRFKNHPSSSVTSIWEREVLSMQNIPVIRESTTTLPLSKNNQHTNDVVNDHKTTTAATAASLRVKPAAVVLKPPHPTVVVETKKDEPSSPKVPLVTLRRLKNRSNHKHGGETKSDLPEWIAKAKRHSVTWEGKLDAQQHKEMKPLSSTKSEDYPRENSNVSKRLSVPVVKLAEDIFELKRANEGTPPSTTINVHQRPALKPISPIKTTVKEQSITTIQESVTKTQCNLTPTSPTNSKSTVPTWMEMALKKQKDWKEAKFV